MWLTFVHNIRFSLPRKSNNTRSLFPFYTRRSQGNHPILLLDGDIIAREFSQNSQFTPSDKQLTNILNKREDNRLLAQVATC